MTAPRHPTTPKRRWVPVLPCRRLPRRHWRRRPGVGRRAAPTADPPTRCSRTTSQVIPRAEPIVAAPVRHRSDARQARRTSSLHPGLFSVSILTPRSSSQVAVPANRTVMKFRWSRSPYSSRKAPASLPHSKNVLDSAWPRGSRHERARSCPLPRCSRAQFRAPFAGNSGRASDVLVGSLLADRL